MKRILVLQNHRIGDLLQTTTMLAGLRRKHSPCHITLLVNKMRADVDLRDLVDEVIQFDQNGMFGVLDDPGKSVVQKYDEVRRFLEGFRQGRFDVVIDVPADTHMHLIASMLVRAGEVRGVLLSPGRRWRYTHPEVMLLYTIGSCREVNRFNLVDLQDLLANVRPVEKRLRLSVSAEARECARRFFSEASVDTDKELVIALQPGASEERKRWGEANFAALARLLVERMGARVVLCGSTMEKDLGEKISAAAGVPLISGIGRTDIALLAAILQHSGLLITNDTGTMHVATAVGTPVVDLSTGPVYFRETGPYSDRAAVVEADIDCSPCNFSAVCHHYTCRERIKPEMVFRIAEAMLRNEGLASLKEQDFPGVRIHQPGFNDAGRLEFLPVFRYPLTYHQFLGFFYAHAWERFYGLREVPWRTGQLLAHIAEFHDLEGSWRQMRDDAGRGIEDFRRLEEELRSGADVVRPLVSRGTMGGDSMKGIDILQEIYQRLLRYGRIRPAVRHFTAYLEMAVESEAGAEPQSAVRNIHDAFRFLFDQAKFIRFQLEEASAILDDQSAGKSGSR